MLGIRARSIAGLRRHVVTVALHYVLWMRFVGMGARSLLLGRVGLRGAICLCIGSRGNMLHGGVWDVRRRGSGLLLLWGWLRDECGWSRVGGCGARGRERVVMIVCGASRSGGRSRIGGFGGE